MGNRHGYTFFFQIATDGERRACCVKVTRLTYMRRRRCFARNGLSSSSMARDGIKTGTVDDGVITLVMP